MAIKIQKATKKRSKLRLAFDGPSGSGKTFTALAVACAIGKEIGSRVFVLDTERGSASLYADEFDFDVYEPPKFGPDDYVDAIRAAEAEGYGVIVLDSLSHAWEGKGGVLEMVDRAGGQFQKGWNVGSPAHQRLIDGMLTSSAHIVATMRTKTEYVLEKDERTGKTSPKKIGMAPVQRQGLEYEFTVVGDLDHQHVLTISKTRCKVIDGQVIARPGAALAKTLIDWLNTGEEPAQPAAPASEVAPASTATASPAVAPAAATTTTTTESAPPASAPKDSPPETARPSGTSTSPASPASAEAAMTERLAVELERQLAEAKDEGALASVAGSVSVAVKQNKVTAEERRSLSDVYARRLKELRGKVAA